MKTFQKPSPYSQIPSNRSPFFHLFYNNPPRKTHSFRLTRLTIATPWLFTPHSPRISFFFSLPRITKRFLPSPSSRIHKSKDTVIHFALLSFDEISIEGSVLYSHFVNLSLSLSYTYSESFNDPRPFSLVTDVEKEIISHRATALLSSCPETIITRGLRYECGSRIGHLRPRYTSYHFTHT